MSANETTFGDTDSWGVASAEVWLQVFERCDLTSKARLISVNKSFRALLGESNALRWHVPSAALQFSSLTRALTVYPSGPYVCSFPVPLPGDRLFTLRYCHALQSVSLVTLNGRTGAVVRDYGTVGQVAERSAGEEMARELGSVEACLQQFTSSFNLLSGMTLLDSDTVLCLSYRRLLHFSLSRGLVVRVVPLDRPPRGLMNDDIRTQIAVDLSGRLLIPWWNGAACFSDPSSGALLGALAPPAHLLPEGSKPMPLFVATARHPLLSKHRHAVSYRYTDAPSREERYVLVLFDPHDQPVAHVAFAIDLPHCQMMHIALHHHRLFVLYCCQDGDERRNTLAVFDEHRLDAPPLLIQLPTIDSPTHLSLSDVGSLFVTVASWNEGPHHLICYPSP
ncbi:MAG: hypothetical protein Q8P67_00520 [archaeon]|nr:hypothetical protein [archaeon]